MVFIQQEVKTNISCHRRTRRGAILPIMFYTRLDAQCDKMARVVSRLPR